MYLVDIYLDYTVSEKSWQLYLIKSKTRISYNLALDVARVYYTAYHTSFPSPSFSRTIAALRRNVNRFNGINESSFSEARIYTRFFFFSLVFKIFFAHTTLRKSSLPRLINFNKCKIIAKTSYTTPIHTHAHVTVGFSYCTRVSTHRRCGG